MCVDEGEVKVRLKPPTAGVRILSIDGGGVRGVVPLESLSLLQNQLGPDLPLDSLFDQAFGTSSGGLITLGLFLKHWTIDDCIKTFDTFTRQLFGVHLTKGRKIWTRLRDYFRCWLSDGCYDIDDLEALLKDVFGAEQRMFDADRAGIAGCKVAVTGTTISDATAFIFSNYNGHGKRGKTCDYKHVRPQRIEQEPFVWEALFKPASINGLGIFQDGGLKHNNPVDLALWESKKIWSPDTGPDVVLSLGTGTEDYLKSAKAPHFRHVFNDGFIPRLCRSFMSSLDGERAWQDLENRLDDCSRSDYFRWNIPLYGEEPRIDDIEQIDRLRASVHVQADREENRRQTAVALLAATFYLELKDIPPFECGQYTCHGMIKCRNNFEAVLEALTRLCGDGITFRTDQIGLGSLSGNDMCSMCGRYVKDVVFNVRHLEETISIRLQYQQRHRRKISGFPHSVSWFLKQQRLRNDFGASENDFPTSLDCPGCQRYYGKSKKRNLEVTDLDRKRRRVE
ncbi:MAG: hypothetical protein Q9216_003226 [Gyalolechia sp. 2 TL-2023]